MDSVKMNKINPFDWGVIENREYKSIFTQKNATYNEPAQEGFTGNEVGSFFFNQQAPTPQIKTICGIECVEDDGEGCEDNGN